MRLRHRLIPALLALSILPGGCASLNNGSAAKRTPAIERLVPQGEPVWREDFGDPVLADLLRQADLASLDVKIAMARLEHAAADVKLAKSGRTPQVTVGVEGAVGGRDFSSSTSGMVPPVSAIYEVDLWGRLAKARAAALAEERAADQDVRAARLLVGAETARAYVALRLAQTQKASAEQRLALAVRAADLVGLQAREGGVLPTEVETRRAAVATQQAQVRAAQRAIDEQRIRLGALLGRTEPLAEPKPAPLAAAPAVGFEVSSDRVSARPDVAAALQRLQAADAKRAETVAASRPRFTIGAALGSAEAELLNLLDTKSLAWVIGANISHNLIDGGAAKARIRGASADADQADLAYRKAVVQGWGEMRAGVIGLQAAAEAEAEAQAADARAARALSVAQARREAGSAAGLDMAAVRDQGVQADAAVAEAGAGRLRARIDAALACGGACR